MNDLLAEHDYGAWEGLTESEIESRFPGELARRKADHWRYRIPGGESYELLSHRVDRWLSAQEPATTLVVMTHDMVSRVLRGLYLGLSEHEILGLTHPHTRIYQLTGGTLQQYDVLGSPA